MAINRELDRALSPLLSDGTPLEELIDRDRRSLSARLWMDPEIHELEARKVFGKSWVYVAHVSELPKPGDFVMRYLGLDQVIVSRSADDGQIRVFLNACAHRGGQVCRAEQGNSSEFRCPYHGWIFDSSGCLKGVPFERVAFAPGALEKEGLGLRQARVGEFLGLVFATWDEEMPSLDEYMSVAGYYLAMQLDVLPGYWEAAGPAQRWVVRADWKFAAEQFSGDGYHVYSTHDSAAQIMGNDTTPNKLDVNVLDPRFGHGLRCTVGGYCYDLTPEQRAASPLDAGQLAILDSKATPVVGTIFPNLSFLFVDLVGYPIVSFRTWNPRGPGLMEVVSWVLVPKDLPDEMRAYVRQGTTLTFSASGMLEGDDAEAWSQIQRMIAGPVGREQRFIYKSSTTPNPEVWNDGAGWPGPGEAHVGFTTEDSQWNWWQRWFECMNT